MSVRPACAIRPSSVDGFALQKNRYERERKCYAGPREEIMVKRTIEVISLLTVAVSGLSASSFSFQGAFTTDDQVQFFSFTVAANSTVNLVSWHTGGGTNAAGTLIAPGGFDTNFTLFDGLGSQITTNDDSCAGPAKTNGGCSDAYISSTLGPGSYQLALTQTGNPSNGDVPDGFAQQGTGNYTANSGCTQFCDALGNSSSGNWAVDITNVTLAVQANAIPEPISAGLAGGGLCLILLIRRNRARRSSLIR